MSGELGYLALLMALVVAALQAVLPVVGIWRRQESWQQLAPSLAIAQALALIVSMGGLMSAFLHNEFSYSYIAGHSNSLMPWYYQISAVWGGHEGSMLLWVTILGIWSALVAWKGRSLPWSMQARVLSLLGMIQLAMISFVVFTSSPFALGLPALPVDGADLNPLLQDPGLIFHPPMLYMGYVGLAVPFAFAMAALWQGRLDSAWARWSRPWTLTAWCFLTLGIALGSWWAYYELGWGGWWFWDPVENASFMPWLAATALLHSLAVSEKRGVFKAWSILLAILAFALSLLGTFLVRSGVLTSVHAFAADPTRGLYVLAILMSVIGGGLALFAARGWKLTGESRYQLWSRETLLIVNNVILLVATFVVLIGTLYPLLADAFQLGRVSVGPPYFNALFTPLCWVLLLFMGLGPLLRYKQDHQPLKGPLLAIALSAGVLGIGLTLVAMEKPVAMVVLTIALACWVLGCQLWDVQVKTRHASTRWAGLKRLKPSYWGMQLAHAGLIVTVLGISLTSHLSVERDVPLKSGQSLEVAGYRFIFEGVDSHTGPNYTAYRGTVTVVDDHELITTLHPEKRTYVVQGRPMTEAAIDGNLFRDLYVALGEPLQSGDTTAGWAVRVYVKPFVRWLWLGALMMAAGGALSLSDRRYRFARSVNPASASVQTVDAMPVTVSPAATVAPDISPKRSPS